MKKLCLNMIVKNEVTNLPRCLGSLAPWISCYAISDTGSKDGTIEMAGQLLRDKPGILSSIPFENFSQARNAAYQAALASNLEFDYIILADADWELVVTDPHCFDNLTEPVYSIKTQDPPAKFEYALTRLVRRDVALKFIGVTHEYPSTAPHIPKLLGGCHFIEYPTGASRPTKFQRDIKLLTEGLKTEPQNQRYRYYLGESYYWLANYDEALKWYQKCLDGPTWEFDAWHPGYRIAQILQIKKMTADFIAQCLTLWDKFPHRAESLYMLARHYEQARQYRIGYEIACLGMRIPRPSGDTAHVQTEAYQWGLKDAAAICGFWVGKKDEARRLNEEILPIVPESERARIVANLAFCMPSITVSEARTISPTSPPTSPPPLDLSRCLVIAHIGDRDPAILSIREPARKFELEFIDYGSTDRGIEAIQWPHGFKFTRIAELLQQTPEILGDYDYFFFPDDDVGNLTAADVERLFTLAHKHDLDLCQPSLAADSAAIGWSITKNLPGSEVRRTNFVECMAPLFSARALRICLPTFTESLSPYGLDLIWPKLLGEQNIAIVDAVVARHTQPHSSYHQRLANGKTAWQELHENLERHGLEFYSARKAVRNLTEQMQAS